MFAAIIQPGVELRLVEERHASAIFMVVDRNREYLRKWMPWIDATKTEDDTMAFVRRSLDLFASGGGFSAAIWADGCIAGVVGIHRLDKLNRKTEIGYWLAEEFQGRGIATAAARAVTHHAIVEMEMNRVEIQCAVGNVKSAAIAKRLGYTFEGVLREAMNQQGRTYDMELYSILRREFRP